MKSTLLSAYAALLLATASTGVLAVPFVKRAGGATTPTPTQILQYALTLEHLESTFYKEFLAKFDEAAFASAGLPSFARGRFVQIGQHEAIHVSTLTTALGKDAVAACNYSFPVTDAKSFAVLSATLEGVGTAAYLGGAGALVSVPADLSVAGSILAVEGRHDAWVESAVLHGSAWSGSFQVPLGQNQVFTLASSFITSCPASNPVLPFKAFPSLAVSPAAPSPGAQAKAAFNATGGEGTFVAFLTGLAPQFAPLAKDGSFTVPKGLQGVVYAVITNNGSSATDADTIAGPAILNFPFTSFDSNNQ